jgi:hypothetical protein
MNSVLIYRILPLLVLFMLPLWPVEGTWFGLPAWVVLAILASATASGVTAWLALRRWPEQEAPEPDA